MGEESETVTYKLTYASIVPVEPVTKLTRVPGIITVAPPVVKLRVEVLEV